MAMVAVRGDHLITVTDGQLHADNHSLLTDIQVAKSTDQSHAVKLSGFFFEPAYQQHLAIRCQQRIAIDGLFFRSAAAFFYLGLRHATILRCGLPATYPKFVAEFAQQQQVGGEENAFDAMQ